jgi:putative membrane protein
MQPIITQAERERISARIAEIEQQTASELVTVVYSKSASYAAFRICWAVCFALFVACGLHLVWSTLPVMELFGIQTVLALGAYWLFGWSPLLRIIVPRWAKERSVYDKVRQLFLELGVTETRDRSGVLIYLSTLERRVEILGDRGVHEQFGTETWQRLVNELVSAIRCGKAATGLLQIVDELGAELIAKFPVRPGDTNELSNAVITDEP